MKEPENWNYKPIFRRFLNLLPKHKKLHQERLRKDFKPIKEGIDNLPQFITFPPTQPIGEASGEEKSLDFGEIAKEYLKDPDRDTTFGIRNEEGLYYIGNKQDTIVNNNIKVDGEKFRGTPGLWELIMSKNPEPKYFTKEDYENYAKLMVKTNALYRNNNPKSSHPKSSRSDKLNLIKLIWAKRGEYEGSGVIVVPSDPNALLERLDLLLASQEAGHTGVGNELVSICDELKRQGVLDTKDYKKLNSIITI